MLEQKGIIKSTIPANAGIAKIKIVVVRSIFVGVGLTK